MSGSIAVAIHDVEPATYERCALIRDWLDDHGVDRVTLLVIPAPDLHPFFQRRPELAAWLLDCRDRGDAIAQHGLRHRRVHPPGPLRALGYAEKADRIVERLAAAIARHGFRAYHDPRTGRGHGARGFAWSTLMVDLLAPRAAAHPGVTENPLSATFR
jgi:predicted deacetylase